MTETEREKAKYEALLVLVKEKVDELERLLSNFRDETRRIEGGADAGRQEATR